MPTPVLNPWNFNNHHISGLSYLEASKYVQADDFIIRSINNDVKGLSFYYFDALGAQLRYTESGGQFYLGVLRGGNPVEINLRGGTGQIAFLGKTGVNVYYSYVPNGAEFQVNGGAYIGTTGSMVPSPGSGSLTVEKITKTSGIVVSFTTKTTNYAIKNIDCTINGDATAGNITFFLPAAASISAGQQFKTAKIDSSVNTVTLQAATGDNIIGLSQRILSSRWESVIYESDGNKTWFIY